MAIFSFISKSINSMIYPIPDSKFPFLGVHITKSIDGNIYLGPNAVLALSREAYKFNQIKLREIFEILLFPGLFKLALKYPLFAINEILDTISKTRYRKKIEAFIGPLSNNELEIVEPGIRAQLLTSTGELIDDFKINVRLAFTNKATINISGQTIHNYLKLDAQGKISSSWASKIKAEYINN